MIIGLSGKKRVGKDTCGHWLEIKHEFELAKQTLHLTDLQISQLQQNALDVVFGAIIDAGHKLGGLGIYHFQGLGVF